jgi:hypothetical protein
LVHLVDDERIYAYRALRFARSDKSVLPGFEQEDYALHSFADKRCIDNIMEEYEAVRYATIALFNGLPEESLQLKGAGTDDINNRTVRAHAYHIAGHELRYMKIIKEKYLCLPIDELVF